MDELSKSDIALVISANMRANKATYEEAFEQAVAEYWLSKEQRSSLFEEIRSRVTTKLPTT